LAAKATCTTMLSSLGGGLVALSMSVLQFDGKIDVLATINGVLGALVGVTGKKKKAFHFISIEAGCAVVTVWESLVIGAVGAFLAIITDPLLVYFKVDDAVGATCVHGFGGAWGMLAVGIFAAKDELEGYSKYDGLLHGKNCYT